MPREINRRDVTPNRVTIAPEAAPRAVATRAAGLVTPAATEAANYVQRALDYVQGASRSFGLTATQPVEFVPDPGYQQTSSGAIAVHLQQHYKSIPVFQATQAVQFAPDGTLMESVGSSVPVETEVPVTPTLRVQEAVLKAAQYVAEPLPEEQIARDQFGQPLAQPVVDLTGFQPTVTATFHDLPEQPAVLAPGPFGDEIKASLTLFPVDNTLRLGWEVIVTMPGYAGQYRIIVDAGDGAILYCHQMMPTALAQGNVYRVDGGTPRQVTPFPRPLADYGLPLPPDLPNSFPDHWVDASSAEGNAARAHLGDAGPTIQGAMQGGLVTFNPADATGDDQKVLNIFYYNCYMHDFFYPLGFREVDGNFQQNNLGRGGVPGDRVDARAYSGAVWGTANMSTPVDGSSPVMKMGMVTSTNRHTAFDSSVVFHEFTHGVTNRLVGGPRNSRALEAEQSAGMGEGWSDYIACTINNSTTVGAWIVNQPKGIRGFPYDANFPDDFGKIGTGRYTEVHNIGEIWCAILMEANRQVGRLVVLQLVIDGLKVSPANPSFLDSRDAILRTLDNKLLAGQITPAVHADTKNKLWAVFAHFGMGPNARSNGATLTGIVADFNPPAPQPQPPAGASVHIEAAPNLAIPDNKPAGISSALAMVQSGRVTRLSVGVDIGHTYIGDLVVTLMAPNGSAVVLHNRAGASADDLIRTYRSEEIPALAALIGAPAQGNWALRVADLAARDTGTLRKWSLDIGLETVAQVARGQSTLSFDIPDNVPVGVSSAIALVEAGAAQAIKISVDITHSYIGDLRVDLAAPSGQVVTLHNRAGGGQDNLIQVYDSAAMPALAALVGQPIQGNWTLRVADLAGRDIGKLNQWGVEVSY